MLRSRLPMIAFGLAIAAASCLLLGSADQESTRRREWIANMTPAERSELARRYKRFHDLAPKRKEQLRALHERLESEPDGQALHEVMCRYCDWLGTLLLYERSDIERLPIDQRVEKIKEKRYSGKEAVAIRAWAEAHFERLGLSTKQLFAGSFLRQIRLWNDILRAPAREDAGLPPPGPPSPGERAYERQRDQIETALVRHFRLEDADLTALRGWLSPATAEWFDMITPDEQRRWVALKLLDVIRLDPLPDVVSDEALADFFQSRSLTDEDRERLMRLPGDEMYGELLQRYRDRNSLGPPPSGPNRRPDREPPFGRIERPTQNTR
jgi:hypothetical protein